jgi:hypothetical protein
MLDSSCSAKIGENDPGTCRGACHQDVVGLEVSMNNVVVVEIYKCDQNLSDDGSGFGF